MTDVDARPQQATSQVTGEYAYQRGFGNEFASEAVAGALPAGRNSPQRAPLGLFAEQLSGTAFTQPRAVNRRTWVYRIMPSAAHPRFSRIGNGTLRGTPFDEIEPDPNRLRWNALPMPDKDTDFIDGLYTMAGNGDLRTRNGMAAHVYAANRSMTDRYFVDSDGELLFVPERGSITLRTELGPLAVAPGEIAVVPRGIRFAVELPEGPARGYLCENFGAAFTRRERAGQRARLPGPVRGLPGPGRDRAGGAEVRREPVGRRLRPFTARRGGLARELRAVQVRHGQLHGDRHDQLRPPGPVHLHRAHLAERAARPGQRGLRDLPAALAGGGGHLPPALVPPQHHVRVHGPRPRRLRRQGRGVRARRGQPAQHLRLARPGRRDLPAGEHGRAAAAEDRRHAGVHVREPLDARADPAGHGCGAPPARLRRRLGRPDPILPRLAWKVPCTFPLISPSTTPPCRSCWPGTARPT